MSVEENIKTAEEHLEAEANRELDRLLGTLAEDSIYEESLLEKPIQGKPAIAGYYQELWLGFPDFTYVVTNRDDLSRDAYWDFSRHPSNREERRDQRDRRFPYEGRQGVGRADIRGQLLAPHPARGPAQAREPFRPLALLPAPPPPLPHLSLPSPLSSR